MSLYTVIFHLLLMVLLSLSLTIQFASCQENTPSPVESESPENTSHESAPAALIPFERKLRAIFPKFAYELFRNDDQSDELSAIRNQGYLSAMDDRRSAFSLRPRARGFVRGFTRGWNDHPLIHFKRENNDPYKNMFLGVRG